MRKQRTRRVFRGVAGGVVGCGSSGGSVLVVVMVVVVGIIYGKVVVVLVAGDGGGRSNDERPSPTYVYTYIHCVGHQSAPPLCSAPTLPFF